MSLIADLMALRAAQAEPIAEERDDMDPDEVLDMALELEQLHEELSDTLHKVQEMVRRLPRAWKGEAESYWLPHMMIALGGEHRWMTAGHESTMAKTIEAMKEYADGGSGDEDDDGDHEHR